MYSAIVTAAGSGSRMGLGYNKIFYKIFGKTIVEYGVDLFLKDPNCSQVVVTTAKDDFAQMATIFAHEAKIQLVVGGFTRQDSIYRSLQMVKEPLVLVHDSSRPFVTQQMVDDCCEVVRLGKGAVVAVKVKDTIKTVAIADQKSIETTLDRSMLVAAQTPQAFSTAVLTAAYEAARSAGFVGTDDASLVEKYTKTKICVVAGNYQNVKFTTPEDIAYFEFLLGKGE